MTGRNQARNKADRKQERNDRKKTRKNLLTGNKEGLGGIKQESNDRLSLEKWNGSTRR